VELTCGTLYDLGAALEALHLGGATGNTDLRIESATLKFNGVGYLVRRNREDEFYIEVVD
jgi:hypothetical protein